MSYACIRALSTRPGCGRLILVESHCARTNSYLLRFANARGKFSAQALRAIHPHNPATYPILAVLSAAKPLKLPNALKAELNARPSPLPPRFGSSQSPALGHAVQPCPRALVRSTTVKLSPAQVPGYPVPSPSSRNSDVWNCGLPLFPSDFK